VCTRLSIGCLHHLIDCYSSHAAQIEAIIDDAWIAAEKKAHVATAEAPCVQPRVVQ